MFVSKILSNFGVYKIDLDGFVPYDFIYHLPNGKNVLAFNVLSNFEVNLSYVLSDFVVKPLKLKYSGVLRNNFFAEDSNKIQKDISFETSYVFLFSNPVVENVSYIDGDNSSVVEKDSQGNYFNPISEFLTFSFSSLVRWKDFKPIIDHFIFRIAEIKQFKDFDSITDYISVYERYDVEVLKEICFSVKQTYNENFYSFADLGFKDYAIYIDNHNITYSLGRDVVRIIYLIDDFNTSKEFLLPEGVNFDFSSLPSNFYVNGNKLIMKYYSPDKRVFTLKTLDDKGEYIIEIKPVISEQRFIW